MDRKVRNILFQQMSQPIMPFIHFSITYSCLHTNWKSSCFGCLYYVSSYFRTPNKPATFTIRCHIMCWTTHIDIHTTETFFSHPNTHLAKILRLIAPNMRNDWLFILCKSQSSTYTKLPFRMTITLRICKLCKKSIRSSRFTYDMAKDNIRHIFHRSQYKKRTWQLTPKIINHLKTHILSYINNHFLPVHSLYIYTMF